MDTSIPQVKCIQCWQPLEACYCSLVTQTVSPLKLLILQHPQESRNPKSTSRLLALSIPQATHKVGLSWSSLSAALGKNAEPRLWAVLYLGPKKDSINLGPNEAIRIVDRKGLTAPKMKLEGVIILDGNWKQSKTLWWRNAWMTRLKRIILNPQQSSIYGLIRRQPRKNCLSTIEATATCLAALSGQTQIEETLLLNQEKFLERFISARKLHKPEPNLSQETLN